MLKKIALFTIVVALFVSVQISMATELVANGDFETGDFTGWTQTGNTDFTYVEAEVANLGPYVSVGYLSQSINTTPQNYEISFDLLNRSDGINIFSVTFGNVTLMSLTNSRAFAMTHCTYIAQATSNETELKFTFQHIEDVYQLDNVSVQAVPIPIPSALLLLAPGLAGIAVLRRKFCA